MHQPFLKCGEKMIVTSIEKQKKDPDKYNVFVDGEFSFSLYMQDIRFFKIKENEEIPEDKYNYILNEVIYIKAQDKALNFLGYKMRTEKEMRDKLETYDYSEGVIERVMEFLLKYGYVDDVIDPAQSRQRVIGAFEMLRSKRAASIARKHDNMPL